MNPIAKMLFGMAAAGLFQAAPALASTPVPSGKWAFTFTDPKGRPDRPIRVYTYRPRACDSTCPIQIVMHGLGRNAAAYRDYWELAADRYRFLVVAPEFSQRYWPKAAAYNLGDLAEQDNREKWTYSAIEHLFDEVRDGQAGYAIFGHSAGGQFVQRMALFRPDNRATVMVAANPGWYTMPEWRSDKAADAFPYSLAGSRAGEAQLRQALAKRFVLMLGEGDNDPGAKDLNKSSGAMRQGATRFERGENFYKAATAAAQALGVKFTWELVEVPKVAHDGAAMSRAAADTIYAKR
jgi:poly(3-hydroxybutyrate) depolymerase